MMISSHYLDSSITIDCDWWLYFCSALLLCT